MKINQQLQNCRFIKVMPNSKIPVEKDWADMNNYPIDDPSLLKFLEDGGNCGILPGNGIAIVDVDDSEAFKSSGIFDLLNDTFTVRTGSNQEHYHFYVQIEGECPNKKVPLYTKANHGHIGEIFFPHSRAFVVGPGSTHESGNKYNIIKDVPFKVFTFEDIQRLIINKVHCSLNPANQPSLEVISYPESQTTKSGISLTDALGLRVEDYIYPNPVHHSPKDGDEVVGSHPVHGSTSGTNCCVSKSKNSWFCHRCNSGGGPLEAVAVKHGIIACQEAGRVSIRGDLFKRVKEVLIEKEGFADQISKLDANWVKKRSSCKNEKEEENKQILTYFEQDGDLYLTTVSDKYEYHFVHLNEKKEYVFDKCITSPEGYTIYPRELPTHQYSKVVIPIVGIPNSNILFKNPLLDAITLFNLVIGHISKYLDSTKQDLEMFAYYAMFTWFYSKCVTSPYLRFLGDTGKGKSRFLRVISDLCFYPLSASGASSFAGLMRTHERWKGTLRIDEADLRGGADNPIVKYLNLGFEKGQPYILCDKNDLSQGEYFDPFGPKIIAMREPFVDVATEGRCISYSPYETNRKDIPSELSKEYFEQVEVIRAYLTAFTLYHWNHVDGEKMIDLSTFDVEPRLKQMIRPLSIVLQLFPDGERRITEYLAKRQVEVKKTRSESWEGGIFNYALSLALGDEVADTSQFGDYYESTDILAVTASMISKPFSTSPKNVTRTLHSIGLEIERDRIYPKFGDIKGKQVRKLVVSNEAKWREIVQRYYYEDGCLTPPPCPNVLRGKHYVELPAQRTLSIDHREDTRLKGWDSTPPQNYEGPISSQSTCEDIASGTLSTNDTENTESGSSEHIINQTGGKTLTPYQQCTSIVPYRADVPDHYRIRAFQSSRDWKLFYGVPDHVSVQTYSLLVKSDGKWCSVKGCRIAPTYGDQNGMHPLCSEHYEELKNLEKGESL